jgi:hypothetical protein
MSWWNEEKWIQTDDHVERLVSELVRMERRVSLTPKPDGWWRVRTDLRSSSENPEPFEILVQQTRTPR